MNVPGLMHHIPCFGAISSAFSFLLCIPILISGVKTLIISCLDNFNTSANDCLCPVHYLILPE